MTEDEFLAAVEGDEFLAAVEGAVLIISEIRTGMEAQHKRQLKTLDVLKNLLEAMLTHTKETVQ